MEKITTHTSHPLYGVAATRCIEQAAQNALPLHTLMQRAGRAVAQLALALAPHARCIWVACGPGNNAGDGLEAAMHLHQWGKKVVVTWLGDPAHAPQDSLASYLRATGAGVIFAATPPLDFDLCVDALLGIGAAPRALQGRMADWIAHMNACSAPILAVDLPTGLAADTGHVQNIHVKASHTLSLLTLKPGLFTAHGRDVAGTVWLEDLGMQAQAPAHKQTPTARLTAKPALATRCHAAHKGRFGDVAIIGGAPGMTGAALLAASAALHAGAGRVYVGLLDANALQVDTQQPELMFRPFALLDYSAMTVVCGCGGGSDMAKVLGKILSSKVRLVLDADALNAIAAEVQLQGLLIERGTRQWATVLTPHPLEAARLLNCTTQEVQNNRLQAAQELAERLHCIVVLKGSGTVIAAPGETPFINPTGNAKLATAGSGDVLSGLIGARLALGSAPFETACQSVYQHGALADQWPEGTGLTAAELCTLL